MHGRSKAHINGSCHYENDDVIISYNLRFLIDTLNIAGTRELGGIVKETQPLKNSFYLMKHLLIFA